MNHTSFKRHSGYNPVMTQSTEIASTAHAKAPPVCKRVTESSRKGKVTSGSSTPAAAELSKDEKGCSGAATHLLNHNLNDIAVLHVHALWRVLLLQGSALEHQLDAVRIHTCSTCVCLQAKQEKNAPQHIHTMTPPNGGGRKAAPLLRAVDTHSQDLLKLRAPLQLKDRLSTVSVLELRGHRVRNRQQSHRRQAVEIRRCQHCKRKRGAGSVDQP